MIFKILPVIFILAIYITVSPAFAQSPDSTKIQALPLTTQSADITKIQSFIKNIINVLVTLSGLISSGFFVWGGFGYMKSSGDPDALERSKKTVIYSAIGLMIVLGAFVLSNTITQLTTQVFESGR